MGAVLEVFVQGAWRPIGFWSKHLSEDKQRWTTYRRELYALLHAMRHFRADIEGKHVILFTDHKPLLGAFKNPASNNDAISYNHIMEISQYTMPEETRW